MSADETRCRICGAEAKENEKGRLVLEHDWHRHKLADAETPVTPLRRPTRVGVYGESDDD